MLKQLSAIFLFVSLFCSASISASPSLQQALTTFGFEERQVNLDEDVFFYYLKKNSAEPQKLVLFIQGTDANPLFTYSLKNGEVKYYRWFPADYTLLSEEYAYAIVPKPGMAGLYADDNISVPDEFYEKNYLDYRVKQIDTAINSILENDLSTLKKVIVYGHSEGAVIAATLAKRNSNITNLGFWSGNVLNNFYEFSLLTRLSAIQSKQNDTQAHASVMGFLDWYQSVIDNPHSTEMDHFGFTNKRWSSYEKAPLDYLLEVDIPIYALFATKDESTPIEASYILPFKFLQNRKSNLSFNVCLDCDHSYQIQSNGKAKSQWNEQFKNFISWSEAN